MAESTAQAPHPIALALGGAIAMGSAMGIGRFVYTPILPDMAAALGLSASTAGFIASANFLGYLLGALIATAPRFAQDRRAWMLVGLAASAASTGAMALFSDVAWFLAMRFVGGAASAFVLVFVTSLVLDGLAAAGRASLSALHFAGVGGGIVVSAATVSALSGIEAGWRGAWIAVAALSLIALALVAVLVRPSAPAARSANGVAGDRFGAPLIALTLAYGLFGFGYVITATFLVQLVRGSPAIAPLEPVIWLIVGLAAMPSVALWSALAKRLGIGGAYALACLLQAIGVLASVFWLAPAGAILAALLLGGTFMGLTALGLAGGRRLAPNSAARVIAIMTAAFGLGQIIGPSLAGWLHDLTGSFLWPSITAAAALATGAALVLCFSRVALSVTRQ